MTLKITREHQKAPQIRFWYYDKSWKINHAELISHLDIRGLRWFIDDSQNKTLVYLDQNILKRITPEEAFERFINDYLRTLPSPIDVIEAGKKTIELHYHQLLDVCSKAPRVRSDISYFVSKFVKSDQLLRPQRNKHYMFFQNCYVEVTSDKHEVKNYWELNEYIWEDDVAKVPLQFNSTEESDFKKFCENAVSKERKKSIRSIIGYLSHNYTGIRKVAIALTDENSNDEGNEGRTGKSLFAKGMRYVNNVAWINAKGWHKMRSFAYQSVNIDTKLIILNDVDKRFNLENIFDDITEFVTVEKKGKQPFNVDCKFLITTNYLPPASDASTRDRLEVLEFTDFFNEENSPEQFLGKRLFDEWKQKDWDEFYWYIIKCVKEYLANVQHGIPSGIIKAKRSTQFAEKQLIASVFGGTDFKAWFDKSWHKTGFIKEVVGVSEKGDDQSTIICENNIQGKVYATSDLYESFIAQNYQNKQLTKEVNTISKFNKNMKLIWSDLGVLFEHKNAKYGGVSRNCFVLLDDKNGNYAQ